MMQSKAFRMFCLVVFLYRFLPNEAEKLSSLSQSVARLIICIFCCVGRINWARKFTQRCNPTQNLIYANLGQLKYTFFSKSPNRNQSINCRRLRMFTYEKYSQEISRINRKIEWLLHISSILSAQNLKTKWVEAERAPISRLFNVFSIYCRA